MQGAISRFGFEWVAFAGILPKPGETMDDLVLADRSPDGLHDVYTSRDYVRVDPNMRRALHSSRPFEWTWEDYGDEHGPRSTEVMRVLADFTMLRGFFVPVRGVGGYEAAVALAGGAVELAPEAQPRLHLMSLYAFERVRPLLALKPESKPPLTPREREVRSERSSRWASERSMSTLRRRCASSAPSIAHRRSPSRFATDCSMSETAASRHR